MAKANAQKERTHGEWMALFCAQAKHEAAALTIKGRPAVLCLECDTYLKYRAALGSTVRHIAARHFTQN